jgi:hypothetical protein
MGIYGENASKMQQNRRGVRQGELRGVNDEYEYRVKNLANVS